MGVTFSDTTNFYSSEFSGNVNFQDATFNGPTDFSGVYLGKNADFSSLHLSDKTQFNFNDTTFPDTINFSYNSKISNEIDFTVGRFNDWDFKSPSSNISVRHSYINLYRTDISKLRLDYIHFKLYFSNSKEGTVNNGIVSEDEKNMVYEGLLNNFKSHGQIESYKLLDIEYQEFKIHNSNHRFYKWLFKYWWNYGYNKEYIFYWTGFFLLLFTCFTYFFIYSLNTKIYAVEKIPVNESWEKKLSIKDIKNRLWFSLMYTSTVFFKLTVKIENLEFKHKRGTFYIMVMYTIGLLCIAYMANFVLQK